MDQSFKTAPISPVVMLNNQQISNDMNHPQQTQQQQQPPSTSNPLGDIDQNDMFQIMKILQKYNFKVKHFLILKLNQTCNQTINFTRNLKIYLDES